MIKFDLEYYKNSKPYFYFFDTYIKQTDINKEKLLYDLGVNYSSYRRCREKEQKVGKIIIKQLSDYFKIKRVENEFLDNLSIYLTNLYEKLYYKIYDTFEKDEKYINDLINQNLIINPILLLFKLFLTVNSKKSVKNVYFENIDMFNKVKKYSSFFTKELHEILSLLALFFERDSSECEWTDNFNNPLAFQILSSKNYNEKKYIESIFYAYKAQDILLSDFNYRRMINLNQTIISSLLYIGNYSECLTIVNKQISCLKSFNLYEFEFRSASISYVVALLGLNKYDEVITLLRDKCDYDMTELTCYLIALFKSNKQKYKHYFSEEIDLTTNDDVSEYFKLLNYFLNHRDKKIINSLIKYQIPGYMINIFKKV